MTELGSAVAVEWKLTGQERKCWLAVAAGRGQVVTFDRIGRAFDWEWMDTAAKQLIRVNVSRVNQKAGMVVLKSVPTVGYRLTPEIMAQLGIGTPCPSCGRTDEGKAIESAIETVESALAELQDLHAAVLR